MPSRPPITDEEMAVLNEFISSRFGLFFPEHKREVLEARLAQRLVELGLKSYMDYYYRLLYTPNDELPALSRAITNNETYFFREIHQFEALFTAALPELLADLVLPGKLRILSAGCSSGEEPYTLNIWAKENQFRMWGVETQIDAFDLDTDRVAHAQRAEYGQSSLRATSPEQVQKYFSPAGPDRHLLKPLYRSGVQVSAGNILEPRTFVKPISYDAVFCRNVLIYFSEPALRQALSNFSQALRPGGWLFLGHSESAIGLTRDLEATRLGDVIAYRKVKR